MAQNHSTRPNILWISLEDTSPRFGCYGDTLARTPNIDRLAATGCRFPNAFSTAGVCAPSRASIITGLYATSIGAHHMRTARHMSNSGMPMPYETVPPHYVKCFPEYLRAAGYYCTNNFKTDYQFAPPFTTWDECDQEAHWRHRPNAEQPFFAVFNPPMTHESRMWPRDETLTTNPDAVVMPPYLPDTPLTRRALAQHYDNIATADQRVGELLDQLASDGLAENTIVFLWSDHGEGLPRGKRWPYDRGIRIPLIVRWPGALEPGSVNETLVSLIDLAPTVLQLAGVEAPRHFQGQPFLGPNATPREYIFASRDRHDEAYDMMRAVRDRRFKYIHNFRPELPYLLWIPFRNRHPIVQEMWRLYAQDELEGAQNLMFQLPRPTEELYDLESDPWEINNLAGEAATAGELQRLRAVLEAWRTEVGDKGELSEAEMVAQWWPDGVQPSTVAPIFIPIATGHPGLEAAPEGGSFAAPLLVQLHCATQGASIGYTFETGENPPWQLYTHPLRLQPGQTTLRAKAIRIGYRESPEIEATFVVENEP